MTYIVSYANTEIGPDGNWIVCGPDIDDHDLTIHIPVHFHILTSDRDLSIITNIVRNSDGTFTETHPPRSINGRGSDLNLAIKSHPGVGVYAQCNWCSIIFEEAVAEAINA